MDNHDNRREVEPAAVAAPEAEKSGNVILWSLIGIALGFVLLYAATRKVDLPILLDTLKSTDLSWCSGIVIVTFIFIALKAWRWGLLLRFVPDLPYKRLHSAVYVGLAINFLLAHVGEFVRTTLVARQSNASMSAVFASVVVERVLDFIALLALLMPAALFATNIPEIVKLAGVLTGMFVIVAIVGLYMLLHPPRWLAAVGVWLGELLPGRIHDFLQQQLLRSLHGLESIKDTWLMVLTIVISIVQWSLVIAAIWCSAMAVGASLSIAGATVTFVLVVLGLSLPNSPLQIGATQLAFTIGFNIDDIPATAAIAASVVYTAFLILPIMLIGASCLIRVRALQQARLR